MYRVYTIMKLYWWRGKSYPAKTLSAFLFHLILLTGIILLFSPEKELRLSFLVLLFYAYLLVDSVAGVCQNCEADLRLGTFQNILSVSPFYSVAANILYAFLMNGLAFSLTLLIITTFLGGQLLPAPLPPWVLGGTFLLLLVQTVPLCFFFYGLNLKYKRIGAILSLLYPCVLFYSSLIEPRFTPLRYNALYSIHLSLQGKDVALSLIPQLLIGFYAFYWGKEHWRSRDL